MSEFYPDHTPTNLPTSRYGDFLRGYFAAAEWLLPTDTGEPENDMDRDKIRGWSRQAIKQMKADCRAFWSANRKALDEYCELRGSPHGYTAEQCAGHDFYLSREGHGAGFFDRGAEPVFNQLQDAASVWGEFGYPYLVRGYINI
jgi:hypothetical protein